MKSVKCSECGFVGWADSDRCKKCGVVRLPNPVGEPSQASSTYQATPSYQDYQPNYYDSSGGQKKGLAIASLVVGIVSLFSFGILGVGAVTGIVLACVAMGKAKRNPHEYGGQSLATAGLVTSILSVVILVPVGVIAAIAIPNLLASRRAANEASSISVLRTIHGAEQTYQATNGAGSYGTIDQLVDSQLIAPELSGGMHYGYRFKVETKPASSTEPAEFEAVSVPLTYGNSGIRSFFVDESGIVCGGDDHGADATERDRVLQ